MKDKDWKEKLEVVCQQSKIFEKELEEEKKKIVLLNVEKI